MIKDLPAKTAAIDPHNLGAILSPYTSLLHIAESIKSPNKEHWFCSTNLSSRLRRGNRSGRLNCATAWRCSCCRTAIKKRLRLGFCNCCASTSSRATRTVTCPKSNGPDWPLGSGRRIRVRQKNWQVRCLAWRSDDAVPPRARTSDFAFVETLAYQLRGRLEYLPTANRGIGVAGQSRGTRFSGSAKVTGWTRAKSSAIGGAS